MAEVDVFQTSIQSQQVNIPKLDSKAILPSQSQLSDDEELMAKTESTVIRNDRGLSIVGTRITLYQIIDCIKLGKSPFEIQELFSLTDKQITDVMLYIETNRKQVEAEYKLVLKQAEETEQYWRKRNQEHFAKIATLSPKPEQAKIRTKLQIRKEQREFAKRELSSV